LINVTASDLSNIKKSAFHVCRTIVQNIQIKPFLLNFMKSANPVPVMNMWPGFHGSNGSYGEKVNWWRICHIVPSHLFAWMQHFSADKNKIVWKTELS